jgi:hypothetical protein
MGVMQQGFQQAILMVSSKDREYLRVVQPIDYMMMYTFLVIYEVITPIL